MLYTQFRENERTARYEVKLIAGNRCQLIVTGAEGDPKSKTKKLAAKQEWIIGERDDASWVDLESELKRLSDRAPIDLNLRSGEDGGAGAELLGRLDGLLDGLYRGDSAENYLTYLGLLNILEYFRLIGQLKRSGNEATGARQIGIVSEEYFECRKLALELDIAELTEWLVAHDIGLPDLAVFYPAEYRVEEATAAVAAGPKKRGKKKDDAETAESAEAAEAAQNPIPESLHHVVELIRLHQADASDLLHFVDDVMHRGNFENLTDAIAAIHQVVSWIDPAQFEAGYHSMKREQARETARQQAAILRQHEIVFNRPKRGKEKGRDPRHDRREHPMHRNNEPSPLEEFTASIDEDPNAAYEHAMEASIAGTEDGTEAGNGALPTRQQPSENQPVDGVDAELDMDQEGEPQFDFGGGQPMMNGPRGPQQHSGHQSGPHDRQDRSRRRRGGRPGPPPRGGGGGQQGRGGPGGGPRPHRNGPRDNGPRDHNAPREQRGPRGPRQPNFDEIQPVSNYSPGLPPVGVPGAAKPGGKPNNKWRKRR